MKKILLTVILAFNFYSTPLLANPSNINPIATLILAELAAKQQDYTYASEQYALLLEKYPQRLVAKRATQFAILANNIPLLIKDAMQWGEIDKANPYPQYIAATWLINNDQNQSALPYLKNIFINNAKIALKTVNSINHGLTSSKAKNSLLTNLQQLKTQLPNDVNLTLAIATIAMQLQQYNLALAETNIVLKLNPSSPTGLAIKATILNQQNQQLSANIYLKKAWLDSNNNPDISSIYADFLFKTRQFIEAKAIFHQLSTNSNYQTYALTRLGNIAYAQDQINDAIAYFKQAATNSQANEARFYLGEIAQQYKRFGEALDWYQSVKDGYFYIYAQIRLATLAAKNGEFNSALKLLNDYIAISPKDYQLITLAKASVLYDAKSPYQALRILTEALKILPNNIDILLLRSKVAASVGNQQSAKDDLQTILKIEPQNATAQKLLQ